MGALSRRDVVRLAAGAGSALTLPRAARAAAHAYPAKDIAFVIPYSAGGGFDSWVRVIAPAMERSLPARVGVIPTNVPAGGGNRGANQVYRAKPDGYTIGIFNIPGMFFLQQRGGFDLGALTWLGTLGRDHYGLAVGAGSPIKAVSELRALASTRPVKFTSTGPEGTAHAATLIATHLLGIRAQLITGYKGSSDYVLGAIRGDGDAVITALPILRRLQAGGTARILATFETHGTVPGAADATALGQPELGQITLERLVGAPPGLPDDIKTVLAEALGKAVTDPGVVAWARASDVELTPTTPDQATAILDDQARFFEKWHAHLKAS